MNDKKDENIISKELLCEDVKNGNLLALAKITRSDIAQFGLQISPKQFKKFITTNAFLWFRRAFIKSHYAYDFGLKAGFVLLDYAEKYSKHYTRQENVRFRSLIYSFILDMLDKLDEWESYISFWDQVNLFDDYQLYERTLEKNKRKLKRWQDGKPVQNLIHRKQCTTPPGELKKHLQILFKKLPDFLKRHERVPF